MVVEYDGEMKISTGLSTSTRVCMRLCERDAWDELEW